MKNTELRPEIDNGRDSKFCILVAGGRSKLDADTKDMALSKSKG